MLQVIVAGAPLPERDPLAVDSHGSGSLGVIMKPCAGVDTNAASSTKSHANPCPERRMMNTVEPRPIASNVKWHATGPAGLPGRLSPAS